MVKLAMPTTMNRLPRMLEWACNSISEEGNVHRVRFGGHQKCEGAIPKESRRCKNHTAPAFCAYSQEACESGTVRLADSMALALAAVPSRMRPAMPWVMPARRKRL